MRGIQKVWMVGILFAAVLLSGKAHAEAPQIERISGKDRYETAIAINQRFQETDRAIVVDGTNFPDALTASALSKHLNAPIYLTSEDININTTLKDKGVRKVTIVGGTAAVSMEVETTLLRDFFVERISGADRYETANEVCKKIGSPAVVETTGLDYFDALLASNLVMHSEVGLMLSDGNNDHGLVVSNRLTHQNDRYTKALEMIQQDREKNHLLIVTGESFPDALSVSGIMPILDADLLLIDGKSLNDSQITTIRAYDRVTIIGGTDAVSADIEQLILNEPNEDALLWPVPTCRWITEYFVERMHPIRQRMELHIGIDIGAGPGESIIAAADGTVVEAGWHDAYGNYVKIRHNDHLETLYAHAQELWVSAGEVVKAGDVIAKVGTTGLSTGYHLHFEVRNNGEYQDPLEYIINY